MKSLITLSLISFLFFSCSSVDLSQPLPDNGADPLDTPFSNLKKNKKPNYSSSPSANFTPGTWVETAMPDAGFHRRYPIFGGSPDRTLPVSTEAKIVSYRGAYAKVELDTGAVGYIPSEMLIEQVEESYDYSSETANKKRVPIVSSSDPAPPSEDEILKKIRARELEKQEPTIQVPASNDFVAPEPEIQGITTPTVLDESSTQISPPTPTIPQITPAATDVQDIAPAPVVAPKIESTPPSIKIDKPVDTSTTSSINAPLGDKINQDAALELRITEPFQR